MLAVVYSYTVSTFFYRGERVAQSVRALTPGMCHAERQRFEPRPLPDTFSVPFTLYRDHLPVNYFFAQIIIERQMKTKG